MIKSRKNFWLVLVGTSVVSATLIELANNTFGLENVFATAVALILLAGSGLIVYQLIIES